MGNINVSASIDEVISTRFEEHYETGVGINTGYASQIMDLYDNLESQLSAAQYEMVQKLTDLIGEYEDKRHESFYRVGFIDGFSSGAVISK